DVSCFFFGLARSLLSGEQINSDSGDHQKYHQDRKPLEVVPRPPPVVFVHQAGARLMIQVQFCMVAHLSHRFIFIPSFPSSSSTHPLFRSFTLVVRSSAFRRSVLPAPHSLFFSPIVGPLQTPPSAFQTPRCRSPPRRLPQTR